MLLMQMHAKWCTEQAWRVTPKAPGHTKDDTKFCFASHSQILVHNTRDTQTEMHFSPGSLMPGLVQIAHKKRQNGLEKKTHTPYAHTLI